MRAELEAFAGPLAAAYITAAELHELHAAARLFSDSVRQIERGRSGDRLQASPWIEANEPARV